MARFALPSSALVSALPSLSFFPLFYPSLLVLSRSILYPLPFCPLLFRLSLRSPLFLILLSSSPFCFALPSSFYFDLSCVTLFLFALFSLALLLFAVPFCGSVLRYMSLNLIGFCSCRSNPISKCYGRSIVPTSTSRQNSKKAWRRPVHQPRRARRRAGEFSLYLDTNG